MPGGPHNAVVVVWGYCGAPAELKLLSRVRPMRNYFHHVANAETGVGWCNAGLLKELP